MAAAAAAAASNSTETYTGAGSTSFEMNKRTQYSLKELIESSEIKAITFQTPNENKFTAGKTEEKFSTIRLGGNGSCCISCNNFTMEGSYTLDETAKPYPKISLTMEGMNFYYDGITLEFSMEYQLFKMDEPVLVSLMKGQYDLIQASKEEIEKNEVLKAKYVLYLDRCPTGWQFPYSARYKAGITSTNKKLPPYVEIMTRENAEKTLKDSNNEKSIDAYLQQKYAINRSPSGIITSPSVEECNTFKAEKFEEVFHYTIFGTYVCKQAESVFYC